MAEIVVGTDWLADHIKDSSIAIVDVRSPYFYGQGHIPGSVNVPGFYLSGPSGDPPPAEDLAERLGEVGITSDTHVVCCDDGASYTAARLLWLLTYYRHPAMSVLDGGVTKWRREGRDWQYLPVSTPSVSYNIGDPDPSVIVDGETLAALLGTPDTVILDVRSPAEYLGLEATAARKGHVPGAINVDWTNNLRRDSSGFCDLRPDDELRQFYEVAAVTPDKDVLIYCHSAGRASETFMVLKKLGYGNVALYVPGWNEWGNRDDMPVAME